MILIDANKRHSFIFKNFTSINAQRVVSIALPFLALHPRTAILSSIGVSCDLGYSLWKQPSTPEKWQDGARLISSIAFGYFLPKYQLLLSSAMFFKKHIEQLAKDEKWQDRGVTVYRIIHQLVHLLSIYQKAPMWIILSLVSQAVDEIIQAYDHYTNGKKPEMLASLILAGIRCNSVSIYVGKLRDSLAGQMPFRALLEGDHAFYNQPDYLESTGQELSQHELLPTTYVDHSEDQDLYPVNIPLIHTLAGKLAILPASNPRAMGYPENHADSSRKNISLTDEWKYKRITIGFGGNKVDAMVIGKASTLNNGTWILASNGNGEFYEDKMSCDSDFKELLGEIKGNGIVFNYPGVGSSSGSPNRYAMAQAYQAMLSFLEDQKSGIGAKKIIGYGHSIGGGVQGDALATHTLQEHIQYVFVKSRTFSNLSTITSILIHNWLGVAVKMLGWNIDSILSSKKLQAPEIILQTANVSSYELLTDSAKIIHDGVIPAKASLAKTLLDDVSCPKENKLFVGIPDAHNTLLSNIPYLAELINLLSHKKSTA